MKFILMHKADARSEAEEPPTPELIAGVGAFVKSSMDDGSFIDAAGLRSTARRVRVNVRGGARHMQHGPYAGEREAVSSFAMFKVNSMAEAIEWGARLAEAAGADEVEVGTVTEPWDLGFVPRPDGDVPLRVLALLKANAQSESLGAPIPPRDAKVQSLLDEAKAAGVLVSAHGLKPSAKSTRISGPLHARRIIDGPFGESKELVGGFLIRTFASKQDAIEFAVEYSRIIGTPEIDVREVE